MQGSMVFRLAGLLLLWLGLAGSAGAQAVAPDSGDFQILQARYGTAERNLDVTERLRELARQDRSFRMGNDTFGTDPDPGRTKVLRIYTRTRDGQSRTFEFAEGSVVDGTQFSGWTGANWGRGAQAGGWQDGMGQRDGADQGEYRILQAFYGTAERHVDVTQRLRELAAQDRNFTMTNSALAADPDPGRNKTLRIYARARGGQQRLFEYREGSTVDGTLFSGWRGGAWAQNEQAIGWNGAPGPVAVAAKTGIEIVNASYGSGNRRIDMTERVRALARTGRIDLTVDNRWAGGDPAPGLQKSLWLIYTMGGRLQYAEVPEAGSFAIP